MAIFRSKHFLLFLFFAILFSQAICLESQEKGIFSPNFGKTIGKSWACMYSTVPVDELKVLSVDFLILDPDRYKAAQISEIKKSGKKVLAFLSLGEAEALRDYFPDPAVRALVIKENMVWGGNFPVRFWDPVWKKVLLRYSTEILDKGFEGFLFGDVDAWEGLEEKVPEAREKMISLVAYLSRNLRGADKNLLLFLQNSHELLDDPEVSQIFDGIIQEGLFYSWKRKFPESGWQKGKIAALKKVKQTGKFVGLMEFPRNTQEIENVKRAILGEGFIVYFFKRIERLFPPQ